MAQLQQRDPERNGQGSIVRSWDRDTNQFVGAAADSRGFRQQAEEVLDLLRRRKWIILLTCLAVVVGAALYTYSQVPLYQTSSLVLVEKEDQAAPGLGTGAIGQSGGLLPSSNTLQSELVFLRNSQSLRRRVAKRLIEEGEAQRLIESKDTSSVQKFTDQIWTSVWSVAGSDGSTGGDSESGSSQSESDPVSPRSIAPALAGHVQFASADDETNVIQIAASDENPVLAKRLADLYTEEYIALTRESSRARVTASREFLQKRAQELEGELEAIERKIQQYQRSQDAISLDQRERSLTGRIADTESELEQSQIELRMERASLQSLQDELDAVRPDQLSDRVGSTVDEEIQALRTKIADLELSKQELRLQSGPLGPADSAQVAQIERRIGDLRSRIGELSDKYVEELMGGEMSAEGGAQRINDLRRQIAEKRIQISGLESRMELLKDRLKEYEQELDALPEKSMQLAQLMRNREYAEQMYGFVTEQLQQTRIREKSELGYATSLAEASVPGAPIQPRPGRNLTLGLMLGLLGGIGLALLRDLMDNRVYKPDQVRERGYREIAVIPNLTPLIEDQLGKDRTVEKNGQHLEATLVGTTLPQSAAAESYRKLRTNLQLGRPDSACDTILVTSPGSGDGKSLTAANLAIVMAQAGHSTLLIDADLRRPRQHELFDISRTPGIAEVLQSDLRDHTMKKPSVENLCVLPAGTGVGNPSEVLASDRFREFLHRAHQYFDRVVVDSSPVLATTDGPLLSDLCDTTLCVVRGAVTTEAELDRAMEVLEGVGANVAGVVFNGFDVSMAYGYKYRYRHYSQYGPYDQYKSLPGATA